MPAFCNLMGFQTVHMAHYTNCTWNRNSHSLYCHSHCSIPIQSWLKFSQIIEHSPHEHANSFWFYFVWKNVKEMLSYSMATKMGQKEEENCCFRQAEILSKLGWSVRRSEIFFKAPEGPKLDAFSPFFKSKSTQSEQIGCLSNHKFLNLIFAWGQLARGTKHFFPLASYYNIDIHNSDIISDPRTLTLRAYTELLSVYFVQRKGKDILKKYYSIAS